MLQLRGLLHDLVGLTGHLLVEGSLRRILRARDLSGPLLDLLHQGTLDDAILDIENLHRVTPSMAPTEGGSPSLILHYRTRWGKLEALPAPMAAGMAALGWRVARAR